MPQMLKSKNELKLTSMIWVNNKVELTIYQWIRIIVLYGLGFSKHAITRDMGIAHSTVLRLIKKASDTGKIEDLERSGHPKALTQEEERRIIKLINSGEYKTATKIHSKFYWMVDDWKKIIFLIKVDLYSLELSKDVNTT
ncbi:12926_t:CDS:2, partial [Racocetra persica]